MGENIEKSKHSSSGDDKWLCASCGKDCYLDDKDYYMVKHHLWKKHGVGSGMLCMDCMEDRLGHKLTKEDILVCPLTTHFNYYTAEILGL
jgi:hypothetical protein